MKIQFNTRKSGFYNEIKSALEDSSLDSEVTVLSNESYSYVEEETEVLLSDKDESYFETNWWKAQASLFPARVKALCTVLRDLKLYGNYRIKNNSSGLSVSKMSTSDLERRSNTQNSGKVPVSGYWTFISKPKIWKDVYQVIQEKEVFTHQVRDCDVPSVLPGHLGIMRVGIDQRNATERTGEDKRPAGVYAIVEITSEAYLRREEPIANLDQTEEKQRRTHIVDIRFIKKLVDDPLTIDFLKTQVGITDKYLVDSFQGSSIPLNQGSFEELVRLANADDEIDAQLDRDLKNKSGKEIAKKYRNPSPKMVERVSLKWERGNEGEKIKKLAGRKCQISEAMGLSPYSFQKKNGDNYCEAHHVVPVSSGKDGTLHPSNVICVSADRHRQLHYGNAKVVDIRDDEFEFLIDGETVIVPKLIKREFT
jgi:hypothetical protein